jgi:Fe-S-cluster-containing hydrogenase component 2
MKGKLMFNPENCTGCNVCTVVCSLYHNGYINPIESRIKVLRKENENLDTINVCVQCKERFCVNVCPTKALSINDKDGTILVDHNKCILCKSCVISCPYNGIKIDPIINKIIVCDLCGGNPQCVENCPTNAIEYVNEILSDLSYIKNKKIIDINKKIIDGKRRTLLIVKKGYI